MIWVIGNRGMLGRQLEELLVEKRLDFVGTDCEIDILNKKKVQEFAENKNIKWIINCAAYTAVDLAEDNKDKAFAVNAEGVENIARIACFLNAKVIHISTDYVYSGDKEGLYLEDDSTGPIGVYGASKLSGEKRLCEILKENFIIRTSWLFGKYGNNFVSTMLRLFKERDELSVVDDQKGSPTYTVDLAHIMLKIIESNSEDYGIYHYSNDGFTTWYGFAQAIIEKAKRYWFSEIKIKKIKPISTLEYPTKARRPKNSCLSKEKIKNKFNINIPEWEDALDRYLKELKSEKRD